MDSLAAVATQFPQSAFAGITKSLQNEWQYLQRMVTGIGEIFEPVETSFRTKFLPNLLGSGEDVAELRQLTTLSTHQGGIRLRNPMQTANGCHQASVECGEVLVAKLLDYSSEFSPANHAQCMTAGRSAAHSRRVQYEQTELARLKEQAQPVQQRSMDRACETGRWLTAMPNQLNGTVLSAVEFRDNLCIRMGQVPIDLPTKCDGCSAPFTVDHVLNCKKGNLVGLRHDDMKSEWQELLSAALIRSAIRDEPLIHQGRSGGENQSTEAATSPAPVVIQDRGDISAHGFW